MKRRTPPKRRCLAAHALQNRCFAQRKVKARKGRGAYARHAKHRADAGTCGPRIHASI
jgi:stalled ribosome alternative rescue factor ArfA